MMVFAYRRPSAFIGGSILVTPELHIPDLHNPAQAIPEQAIPAQPAAATSASPNPAQPCTTKPDPLEEFVNTTASAPQDLAQSGTPAKQFSPASGNAPASKTPASRSSAAKNPEFRS
jgi:hypothetical protein